MEAVKAFNAELSALYEVKPPISKAKMNSLTRGAIKAIKFYKHVVQSVEKFIQKCKPEYKVPGLYVIDSIVRQSRHQFGVEKDVFAPRFAKNMQTTFLNLLKCPPEDKSKVIRVLNLWQKNAVFPPEVIQPLFDLADPNHPIHKEQAINSNGSVNTTANNLSVLTAIAKNSPGVKGTPKEQKMFAGKTIDPAWLAQTKLEAANMVNANKILGQTGNNQIDVSFLDQLQHLQQLLLKKQETSNEAQTSVKFDKKLLDFDYGEEEDDDVMIANSPAAATTAGQHGNSAGGSLESLGMLLTNPEVLRQLQTLQQTMQGSASSSQHEMEEKMRKLQQMKQQEDEFDKHLAQTVPTLPFASECDLKPSDVLKPSQHTYNASGLMQQDMSQPPPGYPPAFISQSTGANIRQSMHQKSPLLDERQDSQDYQASANKRDSSSVEIVNLDSVRSQSRSPDRYRRHSRSRSPRHRSRGRDRDRERKSRSRSRSRRRRSRSRDRKRDDSREKMSEEEREKQRERRKRGLPPIVRDKLSVCSTTLWVGHLSKLVHQEELSDTFGEFGDIVSIDLISPRGCAFICMNRRQDAFRALGKLKNHKMQGKAITLAWAPGKGVKGKEWKDYWEVELGVSYIPWNKLNNVTEHDLELLEEGGMIDEDTLPPRLIGKLKHTSGSGDGGQNLQMTLSGAPIPTLTDGMVNVMPSTSGAQQTPMIDTSQPPPIRATASTGLMPPTSAQLSMMPPGFPMTGVARMLGPMGISMAHGLMPNVPIGVPPPNMQGLLGPPGMMQSMLTPPVNPPFGTGVGVSLLTQIPMPGPGGPSDKANSTGLPCNILHSSGGEANLPNLQMLRQPFGVGPPPPPPPPMQMQMQPQQSDDMDVEMEDAMPPSSHNPPKDKPNLSDQLLAAMGKGPLGNNNSSERSISENNDRDFRERDRDRERERRDRNNDRDRDRGRVRERGRDRRRDRDRDDRRDDRRDRDVMRPHDNSMPGLLQEPDLSQKKDKLSLADRLRQLADGTLPIDDRMDRIRDRSDRSMERSDRSQSFEETPGNLRRPGEGPPSLMDLPKFPQPPAPGDRDFGPRSDFRPQDLRDFPRNERDRGFPPRANRGPIDDFPDPRMMPARFPDEFDRLGHNGPRPEDFDLRLHPRDEFDRRMSVEEYEAAERFEFERRQREGFDPRLADGFDPRLHPDHPDFEMRRREFFGPMEPGFGPMINSRLPRGPLVPDAFGPRPGMGNRGGGPHGPPMFHPRGMGPRGMRPGGMRQFGPRGPPFDPREGEAFFRAYDEGRGPFRGPHPMPEAGTGPWRGENGPWIDGKNGLVEGDDIPRGENHLNAPKPGGYKHQDRSAERDRNSRNRKSRWGNASPSHEQAEGSCSVENESGPDNSKSKNDESAENWEDGEAPPPAADIPPADQEESNNQTVNDNSQAENAHDDEPQVSTVSENPNETREEMNRSEQVEENVVESIVPTELSDNLVNQEKSINSENVQESEPPQSTEECAENSLSEQPSTEAL